MVIRSPDDVHRLRLYFFKALCIYVVPIIRDLLFTGQVAIYHPPSFVFHGSNERLVEREGKMILWPDGSHVGTTKMQLSLHDGLCLIRMIDGVFASLIKRFQESFNQLRMTCRPVVPANYYPVDQLAALRWPDDYAVAQPILNFIDIRLPANYAIDIAVYCSVHKLCRSDVLDGDIPRIYAVKIEESGEIEIYIRP